MILDVYFRVACVYSLFARVLEAARNGPRSNAFEVDEPGAQREVRAQISSPDAVISGKCSAPTKEPN